MVFRSSMFAATVSAAAVLLSSVSAGNPNALTPTKDELCSLVPNTYATAKRNHPEIAFAINELEKHSIATWYSDRETNGDYAAIAQRLVNACDDSKRLSVVVYGIPNKDCEAGYSAVGSRVNNAADYVQFLNVLTDTVKDRKVLYVLEPDAVGLLAKEGGCGEAAGYRANLQTAIQKLSVNPNAEIYLDVGYWSLAYPEPTQRVVEVIKSLVKDGGRVKGITLNTSNYRKTSEIADLCTNFQTAMGSGYQMNCIVDTSRNYQGSPSAEWCNVGAAGIGEPPSATTGVSNLDYFLWIKPPGESDGQCDGSGHTADSLRGPGPGEFFLDGFKKLWDQGFFVYSKNMAKTDGSNSFQQSTDPVTDAPAPTPDATTPSPQATTSAPDVTTSAPDVTTPAPEVTTPAPEVTTSTPVPEPTTSTPSSGITTTPAPEPTSATPVVPDVTTTSSPSTSTPDATTVTPAPESSSPSPSTGTPGSGSTDTPTVTPTVTPCPVITSRPVADPTVAPTETPTSTPTTEPTTAPSETPVATIETPEATTETPSPSTTSPSSSSDVVQSDADVKDAGPKTISSAPAGVDANTKGAASGSSFTGGIIAAVLIGAVALAVAAAMVAYVRRRAKEASADEMKTPNALETAQPAYISQL